MAEAEQSPAVVVAQLAAKSTPSTNKFKLRLVGDELARACADCTQEISGAQDFDAKFLVFDSWLRIFDGEPVLAPPSEPAAAVSPSKQAVSSSTVEGEFAAPADGAATALASAELGASGAVTSPSAEVKASSAVAPLSDPASSPPRPPHSETATTDVAEDGAQSRRQDEAKPKKSLAELTVDVGRRFAKYKRLKEALKLYQDHFEEDAFAGLIPRIIAAAAEHAQAGDGDLATNLQCERGQVVQLEASKARILLAHLVLLNTQGFSDLQKLYLSSASAAPHKLLCLLAYFRPALTENGASDDSRLLSFERLSVSDSKVKLAVQPDVIPTVDPAPEIPAASETTTAAGADGSTVKTSAADDKQVAMTIDMEGQDGSGTVGSTTAIPNTDSGETCAAATGAGASGEDAGDKASGGAGQREPACGQAGDKPVQDVNGTEAASSVAEIDTAAAAEVAAAAAADAATGPCLGVAPTASGGIFTPDLSSAIGGATGIAIVLSSAKSFGALADVKTPPEEVPLWEMPELICCKPLLGADPLSEDQVVLVRSVRRVNCCSVQGPMLRFTGQPASHALLDVVAFDLCRNVDDRRFGLETLQRDGDKWSTALRHLVRGATEGAGIFSAVVISHPPLLGIDKHWAFAMHLASSGFAWPGDATKCVRYALSDDGYATGPAPASELSPAQVKESKHFEALQVE
mmetsp:Transcript_147559/g.471943  ORF Transcript_147559/g.471943 Transcript_147559/m.471943 type:complete len:690 (+) Transcript_147559:85-2154(+)